MGNYPEIKKEICSILGSLVSEEWLSGDKETNKKIEESIEKHFNMIWKVFEKGQLS